MALKPHHVGEELVAELFRRLNAARRLQDVKCKECGRSVAEVLGGVGQLQEFKADVPVNVALRNIGAIETDPMHRIDVALCGNDSVVPCEVKLGDTLPLWKVCRWIRDGCTSGETNGTTYLRGPMLAVLARTGVAERATLNLSGPDREVAEAWLLVVRREVYRGWAKSKANKLHVVSPQGHVVVFDDLVATLHDPVAEFAEAIEAVVDFKAVAFAKAWYQPE